MPRSRRVEVNDKRGTFSESSAQLRNLANKPPIRPACLVRLKQRRFASRRVEPPVSRKTFAGNRAILFRAAGVRNGSAFASLGASALAGTCDTLWLIMDYLMASNVSQFIEEEFEWLSRAIGVAIRRHLGEHHVGDAGPVPEMPEWIDPIPRLGHAGRLVHALALAPYVCPQVLDPFLAVNKATGARFPAFGGHGSDPHRFLPTVETAVFLLGGNSPESRGRASGHVAESGVRDVLEFGAPGEAPLSQPLRLDAWYAADLLKLPPPQPDLTGLPIRKLTTTLRWEDLVVSPDVRAGLAEMEAWQVRNRKAGLLPLTSSGYLALFQGPSGSGKTLAAALLGRSMNIDAYGIDVSACACIEHPDGAAALARFFHRAAKQRWVLYVDQADLLLSDATAPRRSAFWHLLEAHSGLAILGSSSSGPFPELRRRRFQAALHFRVPVGQDCERLWKATLARAFKPIGEVYAQRYHPFLQVGGAFDSELTPGEIANVARTIATGDHMRTTPPEVPPVKEEYVRDAIRRQLQLRGDAAST